MVSFFKRHKITCLVVFVLGYLIIGSTAPFLHYKKISVQTAKEFSPENFYREEAGCDRAMLLETNLSAWEERLRLLDRARERIILATFDMRPGESTRDILAVLLQKAEEGVSVRILVDGISGAIRMEGEPLFYALSSHPNVEIKLYNRLNLLQPWKLQGRMHDKYVIVDEEAYILGGRNTFDYFIGNYTKKNISHDREVLVYNTDPKSRESSLYQVEAYFEKVWNLEDCTYFHNEEKLGEKKRVREQTVLLEERYEMLKETYPGLFEDFDYKEHTHETNGIRLISNPVHIYGKEPVVFYQVAELMKQAKEQVIIQTPYAVCNEYMYEELTQMAEAVPDTKMLINSVENGDNFVASSDYLRNKEKIIETGITLYEYDGGISNHGKSIVIDGQLSLIGSYNLDLRSSYLDTELMLAIQSQPLTAELTGYLQEMEEDCRRVIDEDTYEVPEHITVEEVSLWKRAAWHIVGFCLQPFRCLI